MASSKYLKNELDILVQVLGQTAVDMWMRIRSQDETPEKLTGIVRNFGAEATILWIIDRESGVDAQRPWNVDTGVDGSVEPDAPGSNSSPVNRQGSLRWVLAMREILSLLPASNLYTIKQVSGWMNWLISKNSRVLKQRRRIESLRIESIGGGLPGHREEGVKYESLADLLHRESDSLEIKTKARDLTGQYVYEFEHAESSVLILLSVDGKHYWARLPNTLDVNGALLFARLLPRLSADIVYCEKLQLLFRAYTDDANDPDGLNPSVFTHHDGTPIQLLSKVLYPETDWYQLENPAIINLARTLQNRVKMTKVLDGGRLEFQTSFRMGVHIRPFVLNRLHYCGCIDIARVDGYLRYFQTTAVSLKNMGAVTFVPANNVPWPQGEFAIPVMRETAPNEYKCCYRRFNVRAGDELYYAFEGYMRSGRLLLVSVTVMPRRVWNSGMYGALVG